VYKEDQKIKTQERTSHSPCKFVLGLLKIFSFLNLKHIGFSKPFSNPEARVPRALHDLDPTTARRPPQYFSHRKTS